RRSSDLLLGGARGVAALAAVRVVGRVVVLLRLGGGDSGVDRVDDVLPVPVRRREDVQLAVLPKNLAVEDAAGLRVGDVLAAQLSVPDVARVVVADLQPGGALQHVAVDVDAVPVALAPLFAADPDDLLCGVGAHRCAPLSLELIVPAWERVVNTAGTKFSSRIRPAPCWGGRRVGGPRLPLARSPVAVAEPGRARPGQIQHRPRSEEHT